MTKVILLTGASKGLGLEIAAHLLTQNIRLIATSRTTFESLSTRPKELFSKPNSLYFPMDLSNAYISDKSSPVAPIIAEAEKRWGKFEISFIHCGGLLQINRVENSLLKDWREIFEVNLFSAVGIIKEVIHLMKDKDEKSKIILVSSGAASNPYHSWSSYGSTKAAMNMLAGTLGLEEPSITTLAIRPGVVDTDMQLQIRETGKAKGMPDNLLGYFQTSFDEKRLVSPVVSGKVIADAALFAPHELSGGFYSYDDQEFLDKIKKV